MCGIAGVRRGHGRPAEATMLRAMSDRLVHRGPDQSGVVLHGSIGLAATRLSLVDLSEAGDQPFSDGSAVLTFNGEVYNHRDLARELAAEGVTFRGRSDTEVVFCALRLWGVEATLPRLDGMFAFAFADLVRDEVWLARDRLGIKPLVWTEVDGDVAWASEAKALAPVRPLTPDPVQSVFSVAGRVERSAHRTAFSGVHRLPPGHWLHLGGAGRRRPTAWWRLTDAVDEPLHDELRGLDPEALVDRFDRLLADAVARTSTADAPVGAFISGGVDSSLVAAHLPAGQAHPLLTADIGGARSELAAAEATAAALGREVTAEPFPRAALLEDWAVATWHAEIPLITHLNALPFRRLASRARDLGVKAALTGEGADELFFGYGEIAARRMTSMATAPLRAVRRAAALLPDPVGAALARRTSSQGEFLVDLIGGFAHDRLRGAGADAFDFLSPSDAARQGEVLVWLGEHLPTLTHRNDAMGMACSLEARFPFLDERVVGFGVNLPIAAKIAPTIRLGDPRHPFLLDKAIVRRAAARHLPLAIARREKAGFPSHGHADVRTTARFWSQGYVVDLLGLTDAATEHLVTVSDPYLVAKLASVEIFGRLFARDERIDAVRDHVCASVTLV